VSYIQKSFAIIFIFLLPCAANAVYLSGKKEIFAGTINVNASYFASPYATLNLPSIGGEQQFALDIVSDSWEQVVGNIGFIGVEYLDITKYFLFGAEYVHTFSPAFPISGHNVYVNFVYPTNINRYMFLGLNYFTLRAAKVAVDRIIYKDTTNDELNFSISMEGTISASASPGLMIGYAWQVSKNIDIRLIYTRLLFNWKLNNKTTTITVSDNPPKSVPEELSNLMHIKIALIGLTLSYKFN
jgi:hypothetical protein